MAAQTIKGGLWCFPLPTGVNVAPTFQSVLLDAAGEKASYTYRAPKSGTISKVGFLTGTVTSGTQIDVRLETASLVNGDPTGTLLGTDTNGVETIADTDDNTFKLTTLVAGAVVTEGQLMATVIVAPSGNLNIQQLADWNSNHPYGDNFLAGAWSKNLRSLAMVLEYSDGSYEVIERALPCSTINTTTFGSASTPDERGLRFQVPWPCTLDTVWLYIDADGDFDFLIYGTGAATGTILTSGTVDTNNRQMTGGGVHVIKLVSTVTLVKDSPYRAVVRPGVTSVSTYDFDVLTAAMLDAAYGGQQFHYTSRTDAGGWTDVLTKRPFIGLKFNGFDDAVSAGGSGIAKRVAIGGGLIG